jgi:hypothetical protein
VTLKLAAVRKFALSPPEVTEKPHFQPGSFRVRGRMIATFPADGSFLRVFVSPEHRSQALADHAEWIEPLLWGSRVLGVRLLLPNARAAVVKKLLVRAWQHTAPAAVVESSRNE